MARDPSRSRPKRRARALWATGGPAWLAACEGPQSALSAGGSNAGAILELTLVLFIGGGVIFLAVMGLAGYAVFARPDRFPGTRAWIVGGGIVFPVVALTALQIHEFAVARRLAAQGSADMLRVEVTGRMWWWDVRYGDGPDAVRTANEIVIPAGRPVEFVVKAADVIHSFWVPSLAGKIDMIPGLDNRLVLVGEKPGVYRGQCAEYCGAQHALMAFDVIVEPPERFDAWLAAQRQPAAAPADPALTAGRDAFLKIGCGACHTVRGTPAAGVLGPDLTHVGGRRRLAAGTLPNGAEALAGWIVGAQHIKPDNRMPSFPILDGESLRAVAAWLESLT